MDYREHQTLYNNWHAFFVMQAWMPNWKPGDLDPPNFEHMMDPNLDVESITQQGTLCVEKKISEENKSTFHLRWMFDMVIQDPAADNDLQQMARPGMTNVMKKYEKALDKSFFSPEMDTEFTDVWKAAFVQYLQKIKEDPGMDLRHCINVSPQGQHVMRRQDRPTGNTPQDWVCLFCFGFGIYSAYTSDEPANDKGYIPCTLCNIGSFKPDTGMMDGRVIRTFYAALLLPTPSGRSDINPIVRSRPEVNSRWGCHRCSGYYKGKANLRINLHTHKLCISDDCGGQAKRDATYMLRGTIHCGFALK